MTTGHKHRTVKVKQGSLLHRVLTVEILHTSDLAWVDRSRFVFGPCDASRGVHLCWVLRPLGVLHGLTGLTLRVSGEVCDE